MAQARLLCDASDGWHRRRDSSACDWHTGLDVSSSCGANGCKGACRGDKKMACRGDVGILAAGAGGVLRIVRARCCVCAVAGTGRQRSATCRVAAHAGRTARKYRYSHAERHARWIMGSGANGAGRIVACCAVRRWTSEASARVCSIASRTRGGAHKLVRNLSSSADGLCGLTRWARARALALSRRDQQLVPRASTAHACGEQFRGQATRSGCRPQLSRCSQCAGRVSGGAWSSGSRRGRHRDRSRRDTAARAPRASLWDGSCAPGELRLRGRSAYRLQASATLVRAVLHPAGDMDHHTRVTRARLSAFGPRPGGPCCCWWCGVEESGVCSVVGRQHLGHSWASA